MTTADGAPVLLPDGRPLRWDGHESAHEWTGAGTFVSLGQMPGREVQVLVTAPPAGTTLLAVEQARTLADAVKADGAVELGDAIGRTLARLDDGQDDGPAAAEATDQGGAAR